MTSSVRSAATSLAAVLQHPLTSFLSLLIAVFAIWLGFRADKQLHESNTALRQVTWQVEHIVPAVSEIQQNLATRYISEFPKFMPDVVSVLRDAVDSIFIATDLPGYGI